MILLNVRNAESQNILCNLDRIPDRCPICHNGIQPVDPGVNRLSREDAALERVFICPVTQCNRFFVARYSRNPHSGYYFLDRCVPTELRNYPQSPELEKISPDFCAIYNEAHKAEQLGLLLISGPGYRKALEFLVKDYLTLVNKTEEAKKQIATGALMGVIKTFVTDSRTRTTAERATWLGNDETHYIRKWEDKDLQDLKKFIQLTCHWIQSEHLTGEAAIDMPEGKK
jgi:hypothetical protein